MTRDECLDNAAAMLLDIKEALDNQQVQEAA